MQIELGDIVIDVEQKDIKNVHLSVYPPNGKVRISAPERMNMDTIRVYAISKLKWIKKQQEIIKKQERETEREFLTKESHYFLGKRYLLKVIEEDAPARIVLKHNDIILYIRPETPSERRKFFIEEWYRAELKKLLPKLVAKWEKKIGVQSSEFGVKKMRTKWGTCNPTSQRIWFNLELAKKPVECIEYIVVHELIHLIERRHNEHFRTLMHDYLPKWQFYKEELNRLPFSHLDWKY